MQIFKQHVLKFIVGGLWVIFLWQFYTYQEAHGLDTTTTALRVFDFVTMTAWGPIVYIFFYAVRPLTFFPAIALTVLAGIFFGLIYGTLLTIIAASVSASVAYGVGRFFGHNLKLEETIIGAWVNVLRKNTFTAILTMRLIFLPFDLVSYIAGTLKTKFAPFLSATFLGTILGIITFVSIGASLDINEFKMEGFTYDIFEPRFLALSAVIFIVSLIISRVLKRWKTAD